MGSKAAGSGPLTGGRARTVLLVEDEASVARFTSAWLQALDFEVIVCANGKEACDLAARRTEPIDLLVADVMLPGLRGPVLAEVLRGSHPETAVLFTSGYSPELLGEMFSSHIDSALLLYKPYSSSQLASRVQLALARKAASRHATDSPGETESPKRPRAKATTAPRS